MRAESVKSGSLWFTMDKTTADQGNRAGGGGGARESWWRKSCAVSVASFFLCFFTRNSEHCVFPSMYNDSIQSGKARQPDAPPAAGARL